MGSSEIRRIGEDRVLANNFIFDRGENNNLESEEMLSNQWILYNRPGQQGRECWLK